MTRSLRAAIAAAVLLIAPVALAVEPSRIAIVEPAHPDAMVREAATRLQAELTAAGFAVMLVEAAPGADPRASVESAAAGASPVATVAIIRTERGATADVWVADHVTNKTLVRRVDTGATADSNLPAALAIRAVELLRASLLEVTDRHVTSQPSPAIPSDVARWTAVSSEPPPPPPLPPARALFERFSFEVGFAALYGLGDTGGRLAPTLRVAYGASNGLAGRLTVTGPTAFDQLAMLEVVYGFDRSWRTLTPVVSLGAGFTHTYMKESGGPEDRQLRTRAWSAVMGGSLGIGARASDRAAFVFDTHLLCAIPTAGAVVDTVPVAGKPQALAIVSLGVVAGF